MNTHNIQNVKISLLEACKNYVSRRIDNAQQAIESARAAASDDTKSSAGDKFETTREMMQQELNRHLQLLADAKRMAQVLHDLTVSTLARSATLGSLVETDRGTFFISVSVGQLKIGTASYWAISPASPLGQQLIGSKVGDEVAFNGMNYQIINIG